MVKVKIVQSEEITKEELIKRFKAFNARAKRMFELSFISKLEGSGVTMNFKLGQPSVAELRGPDEEATMALCNNLRLFIQKGDPLYIQHLEAYYQSKHVTEQERNLYTLCLEYLQDFEARYPLIGVTVGGEKISGKRIFEVFLYGYISHTTEDKAKTLEEWRSMGPLYPLLQNEFITIVYGYLQMIWNFVICNRTVIDRLESTTAEAIDLR